MWHRLVFVCFVSPRLPCVAWLVPPGLTWLVLPRSAHPVLSRIGWPVASVVLRVVAVVGWVDEVAYMRSPHADVLPKFSPHQQVGNVAAA